MPPFYPRPELTEQQIKEASMLANRLIKSARPAQWIAFVVAMATENMRLLAECNEHRAARGFDPLPEYKVKQP